MSSALGIFNFLTMSRRPTGPAAKIVLESRAGVNGFAAWHTGIRGETQTVETWVDTTNYAGAEALARLYAAAVGSVLPIMYAGAILPYQALVLSVDAQPEPLVVGFGGLSGVSRAGVRATWQILTR